MKKLERLSSVFWLLIGLYVLFHGYGLGFGEFSEPGPGFIFILIGALLSILSAFNLVGTFFMGGKESEPPQKMWSGLKWQKNIIILIVIYVCKYSFSLLGFYLSIFLLMLFLFRLVEPMKWWIVIIAALITVTVVYGVFEWWLNVPFPRGLLGI